jgi:hypothetical protein
MSRLVDSKKETQKERNRDKSAAERVALNFPIQSTAAVILKYAMIVAVEEIEKQGWCPVYGLSIPSKLGSLRYTDIVCAVIHSVHDELVNLVQDSSLDKVIPPLYRRMQIKDILARATLKVRYSLELDCEYDNTRSWTATEALDTARIYCLMEQQRNGVPIVLQEVEKRYIIPIVQVKYTDIQQHAGLLQDLLALRTQAGQETSCLVSIEHDSKVCVMELSCKLETLLGIGVPSRLGDTLCRV